MDQPKKTKAESGAVAKLEDLQPTYQLKDGTVVRKRILTGDRTTGKLHLGHYVGSLKNRVELQHKYDTFILMADVQALTTHWENPKILKESVREVALDYLAAGMDPYTGGIDDGSKPKIVVQSAVPAIAELTVLYGLVTPMSLILDNPTTKAEAQQYGMGISETTGYDSPVIPEVLFACAELIIDDLQREFPEVGDVEQREVLDAANVLMLSLDVSQEAEIQALKVRELSDYSQGIKIEILNFKNKYANRINEAPIEDLRNLADSIMARTTSLRPSLLFDLQNQLGEVDFQIFQSLLNLPNEDWFYDDPFYDFLFYLMNSSILRKDLRSNLIAIRRKQGLRQMNLGFLSYPVSQAADITFVNAHLVPVGEDQVPHIELTREIARRMNKQYGKRKRILTIPQALLGSGGVLKGLDGNAKMSKSLNNAVYLSDSDDVIWKKVKQAVTDPQRIRKDDPGRPEICTIFGYHKLFNAEAEPSIAEAALPCPTVDETADACRKGQIGCVDCKKNLAAKLKAMLDPMRERRAYWENHIDDMYDILKEGTRRGCEEGNATVERVKNAMCVDYWD